MEDCRRFCSFSSFLWLTFLILLDCNRYYGYCPEREFNDSVGPLKHEGDRVSCRVENETVRPIPPGSLPGQFFTTYDRSRPAWILVSILSCITTVANLVLIWNHPKKGESVQTGRRSFSHHQSEHGRVSWIIYFCTVIIIVYQSINIAKVVDCRPENGAEIFYTVMLAIDVSMQGAFILSEVVVSKYFGTKTSNLRSIVLGFIGLCNLFMWGHSIADAVCREELDNAAIVGYQIWEFLDPLFGSAVVFFRILSGCLYISLAVPSKDTPEDHLAGKPFARSMSIEANCPIAEEDKKNSVGLTKFMMTNRKIRMQTLTIFNEPEATNFYYSAQNDRVQRNTIRSYYGSVVAIFIVAVPFVAYDALARHAGKEQESQLKYAVELVTNILLIILCGGFIVWHGIREWWNSPICKNDECRKRLFGYGKKKDSNTAKCAEKCKAGCGSCRKCDTCKKCKSCCSNSVIRSRIERVRHTLMHVNVEIPVFFVFTLSAVLFYTALAVVEHGGDRATDIIGIFAVILHSVFVFWTALVHNPLKLLWRGNRSHSRNSFFLSLLFATTVGSLAIDIEREHLDHDVHEKPYLRAWAPLLVDFRVHAAVLTYGVLSEFFQQRLTERELEEKNIFKRVENPKKDGCKCSRSGCETVYCQSSGEAFWERANKKCESKPYCGKCFKDFIVKVGFCLTCGDPVTCQPETTSHDNVVNEKYARIDLEEQNEETEMLKIAGQWQEEHNNDEESKFGLSEEEHNNDEESKFGSSEEEHNNDKESKFGSSEEEHNNDEESKFGLSEEEIS